jgi:DNA-binding NarL/FixJ family response regulator
VPNYRLERRARLDWQEYIGTTVPRRREESLETLDEVDQKSGEGARYYGGIDVPPPYLSPFLRNPLEYHAAWRQGVRKKLNRLSDYQISILQILVEGMSDESIAEALGRSLRAIRQEKTRIKKRLLEKRRNLRR